MQPFSDKRRQLESEICFEVNEECFHRELHGRKDFRTPVEPQQQNRFSVETTAPDSIRMTTTSMASVFKGNLTQFEHYLFRPSIKPRALATHTVEQYPPPPKPTNWNLFWKQSLLDSRDPFSWLPSTWDYRHILKLSKHQFLT